MRSFFTSAMGWPIATVVQDKLATKLTHVLEVGYGERITFLKQISMHDSLGVEANRELVLLSRNEKGHYELEPDSIAQN